MKVAFITPFDLAQAMAQAKQWKNPFLVSYFSAKAIQDDPSFHVSYIHPIPRRRYELPFSYKRKICQKLSGRRYLLFREPLLLQDYGRQVARQIAAIKPDVVFASGTVATAYLDCEPPILSWSDATFAGMLDFYPYFSNLCRQSIRHGHAAEQSALDRSRTILYTSDWAARTAVNSYGIDPARIHIVPRGAAIEREPTLAEVKEMIARRPSDQCRLLFIGQEWHRKGGDTAVAITQALNRMGLSTRLTVVGQPPCQNGSLPSPVEWVGFISKSSQEGREMMNRLMAESHFLLLPSRAESFGVVVCEASAFGVPSITSDVGGFPSVVNDDVNGRIFSFADGVAAAAAYIADLMADYGRYQELALSSYSEYQARLNWRVVGQQLRQHIKNTVG
ncbi:MAG TPA: glycosyltransferase [Anaerolineae bacterium]|nr:glycosyltransferase [Anaerolineae bacterium]